MKLSREEAWAGTLESMVDNRVVFYLRRYNRDYGTSATFGDCDRATAFGKRT